MKKLFGSFIFILFLGSCVPPGLLITSEQKVAQLNSDIINIEKKHKDSLLYLANKEKEYLNQISLLKENILNNKNSNIIKIDTSSIEKLIISDLSNKLEAKGINTNIFDDYHYCNKIILDNTGFLNRLKNQLKLYDNKIVYVKIDKTSASIELSDKLFFAQGSSFLTKQSLQVLDKIALILKSYPSIDVTIEGHTDNVKVRTQNKFGIVDNLDLSLRRSAYVARLLSNKYGISPKSIVVSGRGEYIPLMDNKTKDGKNKNRRIRILLNPKFSDLIN